MKSGTEKQEANEKQKRVMIRLYFERIHKYNSTKAAFQKLLITLSFCSFMLLITGRLQAFFAYFFLLAIVYYLSRPRLPISEKFIDSWLNLDREELVRKAEGKLSLTQESRKKGIPFWSGVYKPSIDFDNDPYYKNLDEARDDYFVEQGVDNRLVG
jgi:hypothetical protein